MLPRRKAQQENEKADQVYRYQVREAEKSPVVLMYNIKQNMLLDKQVNFLEKSKKMVVNRITINQKVMFSAFKRRLNGAKMTHARIKGDLELQQELREQAMHGSRYGLSLEDEDMLHRIWKPQKDIALDTSMRSSNTDNSNMTNLLQKPAQVSQSASLSSVYDDPKHQSDLNKKLTERIKPTSAITPRNDGMGSGRHEVKARSKSAVPVIKVVDVEGQEEILREKEQLSGRSENTHVLKFSLPDINPGDNASVKQLNGQEQGTVNENSKKKGNRTKSDTLKPQANRNQLAITRSDSCTSIFDEVEKGPTLLELHKQRLENSDIIKRINNLLDSMATFSQDRALIDRDHYKHAVEARAKEGWGQRERSNSMLKTGDDERKRALGNPNIVSMTIKPLNCNTSGKPKLKVHFS